MYICICIFRYEVSCRSPAGGQAFSKPQRSSLELSGDPKSVGDMILDYGTKIIYYDINVL